MNRFALSAFTGLVAELERPFRIHPMDDWVNLLLAVGNPAGPILTYPEAFEGEYGHACQMRMESDCLIEVKVPNIGVSGEIVRHAPAGAPASDAAGRTHGRGSHRAGP
jgi:crotonobetainyl-CoA:carnitine CoA-transferase CaiB-like acyl-CoA transferase